MNTYPTIDQALGEKAVLVRDVKDGYFYIYCG